ncbi:uncharacterized protein LOC122048203 [Zingiber officinale]|uniref:uncharacterized protein LOC122048203 n=1 Tax=Zingiber officinale TaxID=94328 RepID=UPI001C4BBDB0|nr:uncharacterized protein LOC122048203 [Zingiber officinale]
MAPKRQTKRKSRFKLQTEIDMQPSAMCINHTDRHSIEQDSDDVLRNTNRKKRVGMAPKRRTKRKSRFKLQTEIDMQPSAMCTNHTDRHSIEQGTLNNHRDAASNQFHVDVQDHIPHVENNSAVPDQNDDMNDKSNEDSDDVLRNTNRKKRGPTFMKEIWGRPSTLPRIEITCDDMGRPIGTKRNKFTDFLGSLARNGKYCPIDVENWHKMPTEKKKDMLNVIKEKYDLPPGTENWTLRSIAKKWRNWKSALKKKYYNPELSIQVLLEQRDERAHVEHVIEVTEGGKHAI